MSKTLNVPFEKAFSRVIEELKNEGFGILTEIDVQETLKRKLDVTFRRYTILGACNAPSAYRALQVEPKIGVMLPCNVVIQELADGKIEVAAIDPLAAMQAVQNSELNHLAEEIRAKLQKVIKEL
jgi:uncharacterized protein (DUF302 family)